MGPSSRKELSVGSQWAMNMAASLLSLLSAGLCLLICNSCIILGLLRHFDYISSNFDCSCETSYLRCFHA